MITPVLPIRRRRQIVARALTECFAPAPVGAVALVATAWRFAPDVGGSVFSVAVSLLFITVLPFGYLIAQIRRGRVTDIHVRRREQRGPVILVFLASWLAGTVALRVLGAPHELIALIGAGICTLVVIGAITLRWKISMHMGVAAGVLTVVALLFGPQLLILLPLLPVLAWARTATGDHTPAQVVAGAAVGAIVGGIAFSSLSEVLR